MDMKYLNFCQPGNPHYDTVVTEPVDLPATAAELPDGWSRRLDADWCYLQPPALELPPQGWKVHVSATPESVERVVKVVWEYCARYGVMFKFIRSQWVLLRRNSKYGDRGASGKFITIFPVDEPALEKVLADLAPALSGEQGPYILTDLRIGAGPLYVRYGGFVARLARSASGDMVHCIENPAGELVPDRRRPGFHVPDWVRLPDCLAPSLAARNGGTLRDFPYRATRAIHFSNGGGVYEATHTGTGESVLLKEARPLAGMDESGQDAVQRLEREHWAMRQLADLDCVPRLIDYRKGHEHYFLAREFVDGRPLIQLAHERNPIVNPGSTESIAGYTQWALETLDRAQTALQQMHDRGVVFGDVHPNNILIRPDGGLVFIDFETSTRTADDCPQRIGAPGFRAPEGYRGVAVDRYGLGCLRLSMFLPMTVVLAWGADKVEQLLGEVHRSFPVPTRLTDQVRADLGAAQPVSSGPSSTGSRSAPVTSGGQAWPDLLAEGWPAVRESIAARMFSTASPSRADRLFPGDVAQFTVPGGGITLGCGAAGVLWALERAGITVPAPYLDWLVERTETIVDPRPGLFDGLAGVAYALAELGRLEQARAMMDRALRHPSIDARGGLYAGVSGIGCALLRLYERTGDANLLDRAHQLAAGIDRTADGLGAQPSPAAGAVAGLMRGHSGSALFLLRLFEATGNADRLEQAVALARADLAELGWRRDRGRDQAAPGWDTPYIGVGVGVGGGGVAMLLTDLLLHRADPDLALARDGIVSSLTASYQPNCGVLHGRAGTMLALRYAAVPGAVTDTALAAHAADLGLHAVAGRPGMSFLGDHGLRLSSDLATGAAGVLLALRAAIGDGLVSFPVFDFPLTDRAVGFPGIGFPGPGAPEFDLALADFPVSDREWVGRATAGRIGR